MGILLISLHSQARLNRLIASLHVPFHAHDMYLYFLCKFDCPCIDSTLINNPASGLDGMVFNKQGRDESDTEDED
jgi:hypothetical protein